MNSPELIVLGQRVRPLERVATAGRIIGAPSRATAYRLSVADAWKMIGPASSRWVLMIPLLQRYGIPFEVVSAEPRDVFDAGSRAADDATGSVLPPMHTRREVGRQS